MARTLLTGFLLFCGISLSAQDATVVDINLTSDTNNAVPIDVETSVEVTISNADSAAIPAGDTLTIFAMVHGVSLNASYQLQSDLELDDEVVINFGSMNLVEVDGSQPSFTATATLSHSGDTNLANNVHQESFSASDSLHNDWYCQDLMIKPVELLNFDIDNGTNIPPAVSSLDVELLNNGDVTYLEGTMFTYYIKYDSTSYIFHFNVTGTVGNGSTQSRTVSNQVVLPQIPASIGTYEICGGSAAASDSVISNNEKCLMLQIVDNFDPTDPFNWPNAVEELDAPSKPTIADGTIFQTMLDQSVDVKLYSIQGSLITSMSMNAGDLLRFENLEAGVYMVNMSAANGEVESRRFVITD